MSTPEDRDKDLPGRAGAETPDPEGKAASKRKRRSLLVAVAEHLEETGTSYPNWPEEIGDEAAAPATPARERRGAGAPPKAERPRAVAAEHGAGSEAAERREPDPGARGPIGPGPAEPARLPEPEGPAELLADGLACRLAIAYADPQHGLTEGRVEVRAVLKRGGRLYLRGFCGLTQGEREFLVDQIIELADLDGEGGPADPRAFVEERLLAGD